MKVDIEEAARIYFDRFLIRSLSYDLYFQISEDIRQQLVIEAINDFQKRYTGKKFPHGYNMRKATDDIIDFHIHFNYKGSEHYMDITMYPKLVQRRLKLDKILLERRLKLNKILKV
jgi:hypothetical protein